MNADDTAAHVRDLLDQLGDTPDKVADRFRTLGIKGTRGLACHCLACHCPVAIYLERHFGSGNVAVGTDYVTVDGIDVLLQDAVIEFVKRFDQGVYLDLAVVR
jgi:hypothetical protein